ncbi:hypothetical protein T458_02270 [Brevibacillus panacihumi W25]|uniref:Uncharacterized protein n=1 Tax=Brevibacillus panacihumi W25 TaxID=1408254 RepID=V6MMM5_9BACL|nr:hypothetical protein [Brevibacillus panacihumi]EST56748.1 hypothetical protein T458_02270 [Brevibacillus panacihumi W25]
MKNCLKFGEDQMRIFTPFITRLLVSIASIANYYALLLSAYLITPFGSVLLINTWIIPLIALILAGITFFLLHRAKLKGQATLLLGISITHLLLFLFIVYFIVDTFINPHGIWIYKTANETTMLCGEQVETGCTETRSGIARKRSCTIDV